MKLFDNAYAILAYQLVAYNTIPVICRILKDDDFVKKMLIKEVRYQDLAGPFLDPIIEDILYSKRRMEMMKELDKLADFFWDNLNLNRLRKEIKSCCDKCGILSEVEFFLKKD